MLAWRAWWLIGFAAEGKVCGDTPFTQAGIEPEQLWDGSAVCCVWGQKGRKGCFGVKGVGR